MKIKTKVSLGVGLLFSMIILLSAVSVRYVIELKADTENVLVDNYRTLDYCRNMLLALNTDNEAALKHFDTYLRKQESNITEANEREVTSEVRKHFSILAQNRDDTIAKTEIRARILELMHMNMRPILRKSEMASVTAEKAVFWIAITGGLCFVMAFVLLINLPSNIANPIKELTQSIKRIADHNYAERVRFEGKGEFGDLAKSFNTMAQKLQEYNDSSMAKLMIEKKRVETLIDKMHDPVIGLDENMKVIFANGEANQVLGMSVAELIGQDATGLGTKNDLFRALMKDFDANTKGASPKTIKIFANGKESYFEKEIQHISIVPTGEQIPKIIGHVILLRNVTAYKELDHAKTNFIATVSHEFKTPISSIKMGLQLLENEQVGALNAEQRHLVDGIYDDAQRLLKITGELLNLTQLESGNIQLAILPSDPLEILQYAVNATKTQASQKQIEFEIDRPNQLPLVLADSEKTAWVLINLISNAIRYSYENSVVQLRISDETKYLYFSVQDHGQGIAPEYRDRIFDRYFRIPGSKKEGTGLGLAISKEFIEAQGGWIKLESDFGSGSVFTVALLKADPPVAAT